MNIQSQVQITKGGYETLKTELDQLMNQKRPKLVERLSNARSEGDLSENSDYTNAKEELEFLDGRIAEIMSFIKNAEVVTNHKLVKGDGVGIGTKVTLGIKGKKHVFEVVGEWEADPVNKKISQGSPLGKALVGKKVGDKAEVEAPAGKIIYEILAIE